MSQTALEHRNFPVPMRTTPATIPHDAVTALDSPGAR